MNDFVNLPITSCDKCCHYQSKKHYTGDSWETVFVWTCHNLPDKRYKVKQIGYYEDFKKPRIPKWCLLR